MTRYEKLAITLPSGAAEHVRREVRRGRAASVSAYIAAAVDEKSQHESLDELLAAMLDESGGPATPAELRSAGRMLGPARATPRRNRRR